MPDDLQEEVNSLFIRRFRSRELSLRSVASVAPSAGNGRRFNVFLKEDMRQAIAVADHLISVAKSQSSAEQGVRAALQESASLEGSYPVGLREYALMLFITHFREASRRVTIPPLAARHPEKLFPSPEALTRATSMLGSFGAAAAVAPAPSESAVAWFREDPLANEHHERWHVVYPFGGVPDGSGQPQLRPREGELFVYMHEQMLARYDTERLAVGLPVVAPFDRYTATIPVAYDPGVELAKYYSPRPAGQQWHDINRPDLGNIPIAQLQTWTQNLDAAVAGGKYNNGATVDATSLGAALEASIGSPDAQYYGSLHNSGHLMFSVTQDPTGNSNPGVMVDTATAIRDPVFFQWHRHIDDLGFRHQNTLRPYDFSDAPAARIRSSDIILCLRDQIPGVATAGFDPQAWGSSALGGANWDAPSDQLPGTSSELITEMLTRTITYEDLAPIGGGPPIQFPITIDYLDQKEFYYFLRIENLKPSPQDVTVRIFLGAAELVTAANQDWRRFWIEMDKFKCPLAANEKAVVFRQAADSSVIRKPAQKPPVDIPVRRANEQPDDSLSWCDCGWPYNLLLPRGTKQGMPFRIFVMLTDWRVDQVPAASKCGSMSYCGAKDQYPDTREMGYPFNHPFSSNLETIVSKNQNMALRDITVRLA